MLKALCFFLLIFVSLLPFAQAALENHPSPYIRMHANDAVKWRVWDPSVIAQAKKENKLILISIGYYACHWCHVMRQESFADRNIGEFLNEYFIAVKVDRELNPALDDYLMGFVNKTQGYAGWPLNVFITPDGYPLVGMVYKPAKEFNSFLVNLQSRWRAENKQLHELARQAFDFARRNSAKRAESIPAKELTDSLLNQLHQLADEMMGGVGEQAKFPRAPLMLSLLDMYARHNDAWLKDFIILTLEQMMQGGLHDVIAGGFFRYTVDPGWRTPHFEKMLYTNAGLAQVYLQAYQIFKDKRYLRIAVETVEFILRDMQLKHAGFASSINSQDMHGVEGGGYAWSVAELEKQLTGQQVKKITQHWSYVRLQDSSDVLPVGLALGKDWRAIKQALQIKSKQNPHSMDEKFLPSWNGFVLTALAQIVEATARDDFQQVGQGLYLMLHRQAKKGLLRAGTGNKKYLEDYAFVAQGLFDWRYHVLRKPADAVIDTLLDDALRLFSSDYGWRLSSAQWLPMLWDQANLADAQLPASDVVVLRLLQRTRRVSLLLTEINQRNWLDMRLLASPIDFASQIQYRQEYLKGTSN